MTRSATATKEESTHISTRPLEPMLKCGKWCPLHRPDEVWATYEWVSPPAEASDFNRMEARFIQANIDEVSGKREEALQIYRSLDQERKQRKYSGPRISQRVRDAVQRMSH
jgi:hypothetical protein